ncbi:MAG: hypothetical protein JSV91_15395 [Phycisphaerales bacterium]|nr:MAG: hypothetical protein JSV91_15395 [Phycisphaerales bacterium]
MAIDRIFHLHRPRRFVAVPAAAVILCIGAATTGSGHFPQCEGGATTSRLDCNSNGTEDDQDLADWGSAFDDASAWLAYDPGANGVGYDPDGFFGAVFDGRYIYFVPYRAQYPYFTGEAMRYDTQGDYTDPASWATFDPGAHGIGQNPDGYAGGVFDGRYVYFVPWATANTNYHGEVMRYDTAGEFTDVAAWTAYDPGSHGVGIAPDGYRGAVFDGRFVYFVPVYNNTFGFHGEFLRLDSQGEFTDVSAWTAYDPGSHGVGFDPDGYSGGAFDGRYIYFAPYHSGINYHGEVIRFDTNGDFTSTDSWVTFDPGTNGVGNDPDGYLGALYDGRFVYFVPFSNGTTYHGEVLRYDTAGDFFDTQSWATFDAVAEGVGLEPAGYCWCIYDGRFITFVPMANSGGNHNEVLRYDSAGDFEDASSWMTYVPSDYPLGYRGGAFDGRFAYLVPGGTYVNHGNVLRYDVAAVGSPDCNNNGIPDECDLDDGVSEDCNGNGIPDECDIAHAFSWDENDNGIPDECEDPCPTDINNDDLVNIDDIFAVLAAWGPCEDCPEDLNDDGMVDIDDLFVVLAQWGPCP